MKYHASLIQRQHWLAHELARGSTAYSLPALFQCTGSVDIDRLRRSLQLTIARHESLRTKFVSEDGELYQVVAPVDPPDIPVIDAEGADPAALASRLVSAPFDLGSDLPVRAGIIRTTDSEFFLAIVIHHAVADLETIRLLLEEVSARYGAEGYPEAPPARTYIQYSQWQRGWLRSDECARMTEYWRHELRDVDGSLGYRTDYDRPPVWSAHGADEPIAITKELSDAVTGAGAVLEVNQFTVLLAAYCVILHRYGAGRQTVVGVPFTNRRQEHSAEILGTFANILPIVAEVDEKLSFTDLVKALRRALLLAHRNQEVPTEMIVREVHPRRHPACNPIYQVGLTVEPDLRLSLQGVQTTRRQVSKGSSQLDIYAFFRRDEDRNLAGYLQYNPDLFSRHTIESLASDYVKLLAAAVRQPFAPIESAPTAERRAAKHSTNGWASQTTSAGSPPPDRSARLLIAATFTAEPIVPVLQYWSREWHWPFTVETTEYNQVFRQLLDSKSAFRTNTDGYNVCLIRFDDWFGSSKAERGDADWSKASASIAASTAQFLDAVTSAASASAVHYVVVICPPAPATQSCNEAFHCVLSAKKEVEARLSRLRHVSVLAWEHIEASYPVEDWYQGEGEGHLPYTARYFVALGTALARLIGGQRRPPYKAVVADADGTLWAGVLGEDGTGGVVVDKGYADVQQQLLDARSRGMLLCLCTKNDEGDIVKVLEHHPDMLLKPEHFTARRANWLQKSQNVRDIARSLGIGFDSVIFLDDSPVECAEVRANLPEAFTVCLPQDSQEAARALRHLWALDLPPATAEDSERAAMYLREAQREEQKRRSPTFAEFIADLGLVVEIAPASSEDVQRISQLTIRTNQFNATGLRLTEAQVEDLLGDPSITCLVVRVADRFGDYGLVGVMIGQSTERAFRVLSFMLSCRALGRGVEHRMLQHLGRLAGSLGLEILECQCATTERNAPLRAFLLQTVGQFGTQSNGGISFRIPSSIAKAVTFSPEDVPQSASPAGVHDEVTGKGKAQCPRADERPVMLRIMSEMASVSAIEDAVRAFRSGYARKPRAGTPPPDAAHGTATEKKLAEIWESILAIESVGVDENFFDAGGTSIQMPSVAFRIWKELNMKVSLVELFQYPTISMLARHLSQPLTVFGDLASTETAGRRQREIVRTQQLPAAFQRLKRHRAR